MDAAEPISLMHQEPGADVTIFPVPSDTEALARELLLDEVLPDVAVWVLAADVKDAAWKARRHSVEWTLVAGTLTRSHHDERPARERRQQEQRPTASECPGTVRTATPRP